MNKMCGEVYHLLAVLLVVSICHTTATAVCQDTVAYTPQILDVCLNPDQVRNDLNQQVFARIENEIDGCFIPPTTPNVPPQETTPPSTQPPPTDPPPAGTFEDPATSCKYIATGSPSGLYWIRGLGSASLQYCDMTRSCCGSTGGWMRVADIDMTDSSQQCPSGFNTYTYGGIRTCGFGAGSRNVDCLSTTFSLNQIQYSKVCGRIVAYQNGSTDAFNPYILFDKDLESTYVDGISITHGQSPRRHIWTFAATFHEDPTFPYPQSLCPCSAPNISFPRPDPIPSYVGQNYFCDTGDYASTGSARKFFVNAPLWDGQGCGSTSTCCSLNNPPWFCSELPSSTTKYDIELRLCRTFHDEDSPFQVVEIYVQ